MKRIGRERRCRVSVIDRLAVRQGVPDQHVPTVIDDAESGDHTPVGARRPEYDRSGVAGRAAASGVAGRRTGDRLALCRIPVDGVRDEEHLRVARGIHLGSTRCIGGVDGIQRHQQGRWLCVCCRPENMQLVR